MQYPYDAKYIWSSFLSLGDSDQGQAPVDITRNAIFFNDLYSNIIPPHEFVQPKTYAEWVKKYPYAKLCPYKWSYFRQLQLGELPKPNSFGGSRRSLQKSRLVKRKSRKYKSIKKSKKRSFRKRSGKY